MKPAAPTIRFRVHFLDGTHVDVDAVNAAKARDVARDIKGRGIIRKVKILKAKVA